MLGTKIKELRKARNLNQEEFAEMIGASRASLSRWERNETIPGSDQVTKIAEALHVSVRDLLEDTGSESTTTDGDNKRMNNDEIVDLLIKMNDSLAEDLTRRKDALRKSTIIVISILLIATIGLTVWTVINIRNSKSDAQSEGEELTDVFHAYKGVYPTDITFAEQFHSRWVRLFRDPAYYREIDGEYYIAVTYGNSQPYILYDVMNRLQVGDVLPIDRDLTIPITKLEYDPDWEDIDYPSAGRILYDGSEISRYRGKIKVNDEYFFIHPKYSSREGAEFDTYSINEAWILRHKNEDKAGDPGYAVELYNTCRWVKVSKDCKVHFQIGDKAEIGNIYNILEQIDEYCQGDPRQYIMARVSTSDNKITGIEIRPDKM